MATRTTIDTSGMSKKERIAVARELAAMEREDAAYRRRRNRILLFSLVGVLVLAIVAAAAFVLWGRYQETFAGPENMGSDGIVLTGDGTTTSVQSTPRIEPGGSPTATSLSVAGTNPYIVEYVDYSNPDSATFTTTNASLIEGWLTSGYVVLEIHPVAPNASADDYAVRAANAAACVANSVPDSFLAVNDALMKAAQADGFNGLDDDGILRTVTGAGVTDNDTLACITSHRFASWVEAATDRAAASIPNADVASLTKEPTVLVDETSYTGALYDSDAFTTFISDAYTAATSGE